MTTTVPFTQNDITDLQKRQREKPSMTLEDLMKEKGLGGGETAAQTGIQLLKFDANGNPVK